MSVVTHPWLKISRNNQEEPMKIACALPKRIFAPRRSLQNLSDLLTYMGALIHFLTVRWSTRRPSLMLLLGTVGLFS